MGGVSPAHQFDPAVLESYLERHLEDFGALEEVQQVQGGVSNPTLILRTSGSRGARRFVLRKQPPGQLLASAHQIDREYRVMSALADTGVPVPAMRLYCSDREVIGTPFYVMDYLEGRVFRDARLPGLAPAERAAVYDQLNECLAKLHRVVPAAVGLSDFGRPGNYFARQIARWTKQYRAAETETIEPMEQLLRLLPAAIPADDSVAIAHGDYRLENVMFHPTEPRLIAVLDWELSTLGHPLADTAYNCFLWHCHNPTWGTLDGLDLAGSGIPTEAEYLAAYCRRTGRNEVTDWNFYLAFGVFRLAAICQGVFKRSLIGNVSSERTITNETGALAIQAVEIFTGRVHP
jgi:aminoglycoside phosphotransferase (APT) family kinase protein